MSGVTSLSASHQEDGRQLIENCLCSKRSCAAEQTDIRLFRVASTGECCECDTPEISGDMDAEALIFLVPTQAAWKQAMKIPIPAGLPRSYFVGKKYFSADAPPLGTYQQNAESMGMAVMAQWETAYIKQARRWRKCISPIGKVEDLCADRLGRDSAIESIAGAHVVLYFGHGHYHGLDGYHGIAAENFQPDKPLGLFWSWSCNTLCGRNSFALQLLQAGMVKAYIGTSNPRARSSDNLSLAELSADVLLKDRPTTLIEWLHTLTLAVHATGDAQLAAAWSDYHVLGDITLKLPDLARSQS